MVNITNINLTRGKNDTSNILRIMFCDYVFRTDHSYTYSYLDRSQHYDLIWHKVYAATTNLQGGKMSDILNKKEIKKLANLGKGILANLSCDVNGMGIPCRTDRFAAIESMIEYLKIHDYKITNKQRGKNEK